MKILILSHYFPPLNRIGSLRVYSFAKYLSEIGHEVHVLTTEKTHIDGHLNLELDLSGFNTHKVSYLPSIISVLVFLMKSFSLITAKKNCTKILRFLTGKKNLAHKMYNIQSIIYIFLRKVDQFRMYLLVFVT